MLAVIWPLNHGVSKNLFSRERVEPCLFVTFKIMISYLFPENLIKIPQVFQKIWRFPLSILTMFIGFLDFLTYPHCKETPAYNR